MAYTQARSGLARSNAVRCGLFPRLLFVTVGGTTRQFTSEEFSISESVDVTTPNNATFNLHGVAVTPLQEVVFGLGHSQNRIFAGHVMRSEVEILGFVPSGHIERNLVANDYTWQLNAKDLVFERFVNVGVNTAVTQLLATYTEGGFHPGIINESLGNITMDLDGVPLVEALDRIASAANAKCIVDYNRYVHLVISRDDGNALALGNTTRIWNLRFSDRGEQTRNRTVFVGGGAATTSVTSPGASTIDVDECGHYGAGGGTARAELQTITYTGVSAGSGPGQLTGVSGVIRDIPQGATVRVQATAADGAAATALAAIIGGGVSGVVTNGLDDGNASDASVIAGAASDVALFKNTIGRLSYAIESDFYAIGKTVTVNLTTPLTISGTYVVESVKVTPFFDEGKLQADGTVRFMREVTLVSVDMRFLSTALQILGQLGS